LGRLLFATAYTVLQPFSQICLCQKEVWIKYYCILFRSIQHTDFEFKGRGLKRGMRIKLDIDPSVLEPEVIIRAGEETETIREIVSFIRQRTEEDTKQDQSLITVYRDNNTARSIDQSDIIRIYTAGRKLAVVTQDRKYQVRCTLRELEEILDARWFVRISRFEIINMNWVSGFDLSVKGTIKVSFEDGSYTWVTRRFVPSIGKRLADLAERGDEHNE